MTDVRAEATESGPAREASRDLRWLDAAAVFFTIAVLVHNGDHLRRGGDAVAADVFWIGTSAMLLEVAIVALVFARHAAAPLAAAVGGFSLAAGYLAVHFTPSRSWLSDSFLDADASALSWFAASIETLSALLLGAVGLALLRRRGLADAASSSSLPPASALAHPVVLLMALGNLVIFIGSIATR